MFPSVTEIFRIAKKSKSSSKIQYASSCYLWRCSDSRLLPWLCGQSLLEQQRNDVRVLLQVLSPLNNFPADGALRALGFARGGAVFAGNESFHKAGVAEEVAYNPLLVEACENSRKTYRRM
jgi:hypothetical protein